MSTRRRPTNQRDPPLVSWYQSGAIQTCMGMAGAQNIAELHDAELIDAPSIKTEGKIYQQAR